MAKQTVADAKRLSYVGSSVRRATDSDNDDWYTPTEWIDFARKVMYGIELDPFSSEMANERVRATKIYTQQNSAFYNNWKAKSVWMNPPYSRGLCADACERFVSEYKSGNFKRGIVLVNNMTDTKWYRHLLDTSVMLCNLTGRIGFENAAGQRVTGNTRGQTLFLFAKDPKVKARFCQYLYEKNQVVLTKWTF